MLALVATLAGCGDSNNDAEKLAGSWIPRDASSINFLPGFDPASASIAFHTNGEWTASDGCNEMSGSDTLNDGEFYSEGNSLARVGCEGTQIPYDLLLALTDHVNFPGDGSAVFESTSNKNLLTLSPGK